MYIREGMEIRRGQEMFAVFIVDSRDRRIVVGRGLSRQSADKLAEATRAKLRGSRIVVEQESRDDQSAES